MWNVMGGLYAGCNLNTKTLIQKKILLYDRLYLGYILTLLKHMQIKEDYSLLGHIWITSVGVGHLQRSGAPQNVTAKVALSIHFRNFCFHGILKVEIE